MYIYIYTYIYTHICIQYVCVKVCVYVYAKDSLRIFEMSFFDRCMHDQVSTSKRLLRGADDFVSAAGEPQGLGN